MVQLSAPNNSILVVCTPVFNLLTRIQQDKLSVGLAATADFIQAFNELEKLAHAHFITSEELTYIKSCLAMLIDDIMLYSQTFGSISAIQAWPKSHLQLTLFGTGCGEIVFFQHLEELLKNAKNNLYLIELYYVCLALGFRSESGGIPLLRLKTRVHQEIIRIRGYANRSLSLNCQQENIALTTTTKPLSLFFISLCTLILFAFGFFSIEYILRVEIEAHYYYVKEQAELLINVVSEGRQ